MSMQFIEMFEFLHSESFVHRLDPRSKGLFVLCLTILSFVFDNLFTMLLLVFAILPLILASNLGKTIWTGLKGLKVVVLVILMINTYMNSFNFALIIILRIVVLMLVFSIYFQTTSPEDLSEALLKLKFPYSLAFSLSLAFRFVPTMATETQIITDAQKSRGHRIEEGGVIKKIRNLIPLLVPLLMNSIRRAFHVAEALETRAFGATKSPQSYFPLYFTSKDWVFSILSVALLGLGLFVHINLANLPPIFAFNLTI